MSTFLGASVGRKLVVGISGLFLVLFLVVHLVVNLTLLAGPETYNTVAHWMGTNPAVLGMRPVLVLGLLLHIAVSMYLSVSNLRARPRRYLKVDPAGGSTWASRNMFILGVCIILFLALHLSSFSIRMTFGSVDMVEISGVLMKDAYALVTTRFSLWWYVSLYSVAMVLLGLHLAHGVQSSLQTIGLNDHRWRERWASLGLAYAVVVAVGFAILPIYFFVQAQMS